MSEAHQAALAAAYLEAPTGDETLLMTVQILRGFADRRLDAGLVTAVDRLLSGVPPYWLDRLVLLMGERLLRRRVTEANWKSVVGSYLESSGPGAEAWRARLRATWTDIKNESGLAPGALKPFLVSSEVGLVGGDTSL
ncbi:MAG: hypothetical protein M3Y59_21075 [Myxococcota bacterium]|nr:hypothetical protein [Myxococcota bacterium]